MYKLALRLSYKSNASSNLALTANNFKNQNDERNKKTTSQVPNDCRTNRAHGATETKRLQSISNQRILRPR